MSIIQFPDETEPVDGNDWKKCAAELRTENQRLREALAESDKRLKAYKRAYGTDPVTELTLMGNDSALKPHGG